MYEVFVAGPTGEPHPVGVISEQQLVGIVGFRVEITGEKEYNAAKKITLSGGPFDGVQLDAFQGNCYIVEYPPDSAAYYVYLADSPGKDLVWQPRALTRQDVARLYRVVLP